MSPRHWILTVIGSFVLGAAALLAVDTWMDIYGLLRDVHGRSLPAYGDERIAKYLLAERYVPENFNGLLLGPSITANWNSKGFHRFRIYNASINFGNIVEEKTVADQALQSGKMRIALLLIHPALTASHVFRTARLSPRENLAALGSQSLVDAYKDEFLRWRHPDKLVTDGFGTQYFEDPKVLNPVNIELMRPGVEFEIDPIALQAYRNLLAEFRERHVRTILIVPPTEESLFETKKMEFQRYLTKVIPADLDARNLFDFSSDQYESFRRDRANFSDGIHITRVGTERLITELNKLLDSLN